MRWLLVGVLLCGCSDSAKIRMVPNIVAGAQSGLGETPTSESRIGSGLAVNLKSLKYYVTSIQLCRDVQRAGPGSSGTTGCIQLYESVSQRFAPEKPVP